MKPTFKPTIIALVGNSGTGKTHLSNFLKQRLGIPVIVSYTTRPRRENEKDGRDYYFIREEQIPPLQQMLTYTQYGGCEYFARLDQVPRMGRCVYVLDERGLLSLKEKYKGRILSRYWYAVHPKPCRREVSLRGVSPGTRNVSGCPTVFMMP